MTSQINDGGPAFPVRDGGHNGMTLRDWFAGQVLVGLLTPQGMIGTWYEGEAQKAYEMADAMLKRREQVQVSTSQRPLETVDDRIAAAIDIAARWSGLVAYRHKSWVIDQMVRALTGDRYTETIQRAMSGEDGSLYAWHVGEAP